MAKNKSTSKVTRITANDDTVAAKSTAKKTSKAVAASKKATKAQKVEGKKRSWGALGKIGRYFKGAWVELRQVHWPTRKATWSLTGAVLLFAAFFVVFITLLDAGFKFLFEQILN